MNSNEDTGVEMRFLRGSMTCEETIGADHWSRNEKERAPVVMNGNHACPTEFIQSAIEVCHEGWCEKGGIGAETRDASTSNHE